VDKRGFFFRGYLIVLAICGFIRVYPFSPAPFSWSYSLTAIWDDTGLLL